MSDSKAASFVDTVKVLAHNADQTPAIYLSPKLIAQLLQLHAAANDAQFQLFEYLLDQREGKTGNLRDAFTAVSEYGIQTRAIIDEIYGAIERQHPGLDMPWPEGMSE